MIRLHRINDLNQLHRCRRLEKSLKVLPWILNNLNGYVFSNGVNCLLLSDVNEALITVLWL